MWDTEVPKSMMGIEVTCDYLIIAPEKWQDVAARPLLRSDKFSVYWCYVNICERKLETSNCDRYGRSLHQCQDQGPA